LLKPSYNRINDIVEYLKYMIEHGVYKNKKKKINLKINIINNKELFKL